MIPLGPDVQPMANVLCGEQAAHPFILSAAAIPFGRTEHDTHSPQIGVLGCRNKVHRIVVIDIVVIVSVHKAADVEDAAHGKAIAGDTRVPECEIGRMIASEAAAGGSDAIVSRVMADPWIDLFQQQPVV